MPSDTPDWLPDTSASVDQLIPLTTYTIAHSPSDFFDITTALQKSYQSFYLNFFLPSSPGPYSVGVTAFDPAGNAYWVDSYNWSFSGSAFFAVDVPGTVGGSVRFRVSAPVLGATVQNALYASVASLPGGASKWRRDGRMRPIGSVAVHNNNAAGAIIVPGPGAGTRLLLKSGQIMVQSPAGGDSYLYCAGTIGGTSFIIGMAGGPANQINANQLVIPDDGLLLDDNAGLNTVQAGGVLATFVDVVYDVVK